MSHLQKFVHELVLFWYLPFPCFHGQPLRVNLSCPVCRNAYKYSYYFDISPFPCFVKYNRTESVGRSEGKHSMDNLSELTYHVPVAEMRTKTRINLIHLPFPCFVKYNRNESDSPSKGKHFIVNLSELTSHVPYAEMRT